MFLQSPSKIINDILFITQRKSKITNPIFRCCNENWPPLHNDCINWHALSPAKKKTSTLIYVLFSWSNQIKLHYILQLYWFRCLLHTNPAISLTIIFSLRWIFNIFRTTNFYLHEVTVAISTFSCKLRMLLFDCLCTSYNSKCLDSLLFFIHHKCLNNENTLNTLHNLTIETHVQFLFISVFLSLTSVKNKIVCIVSYCLLYIVFYYCIFHIW